MNNIKFRIYDTNDKEYLNSEDYQIDCSTGEIYEAVGVHFDAPIDAGIILAHGLIAERYIGRNDKVGVDVYQGDIVQWNTRYGLKQGEVLWSEYMWNVKDFYISWQDEPGSAFSEKCEFEVIGTIHDVVKEL